MEREAYTAASTIAPKLEAYFRHRAHSGHRRPLQAALPDAAAIEALINAAFWASLRREEGYMPRISLAFLAPEESANPLILERPLPLASPALTKIAPAVERPGIHLGVWPNHNGLSVWGATRSIPPFCFVLEVAAPGLLVVKHHSGDEAGKFVNVAVLEGDQIKIVDDRVSTGPDCPALLTSLLGGETLTASGRSVQVLVQLAVSMRQHGRGGLLLIVPIENDSWRESIVQPIPYGVAPTFSALAKLALKAAGGSDLQPWQDALAHAVEAVAGLTAVDGALLLNERFEVLGFGAKIARRKGRTQIEHVRVSEPVEGGSSSLIHAEELGGTRHLSAAQFVHDQRDAIALVASQDGRFTIFEWSACESVVHAHRIEVLLL
jgi:hypothetical protein